jgi:hypothetical protein
MSAIDDQLAAGLIHKHCEIEMIKGEFIKSVPNNGVAVVPEQLAGGRQGFGVKKVKRKN